MRNYLFLHTSEEGKILSPAISGPPSTAALPRLGGVAQNPCSKKVSESQSSTCSHQKKKTCSATSENKEME